MFEDSISVPTQLEIKIINCIEKLKSCRSAWDNILRKNGNDNPFIEFDWIEKWWSSFGESHSMLVVSISEKSNLIGFCPLMITKKGVLKEINFIGYPQGSYMDFILTDRNRQECIQLIINYLMRLKGNYILSLHGIYEDSPNLEILKGCLEENKLHFFIKKTESPFIKVNKKFADYYNEKSRHKSIKMMKNRENRLMEAGKLTYEKLAANEIDEIFKLHDKRWQKKRDTSNFSKEGSHEFFRELALSNNLSFTTSATGLKLGGKIIAFSYSFLCNGKYAAYRIAHDDDYSVFVPGKIIIKEVIKECFENGIRVFDFGLGDVQYKHEWADEKIFINKVIFPTCNIISKANFKRLFLKEKLFNTLKKSKAIVAFKTNIYDKIKYFILEKKFKRLLSGVISVMKNMDLKKNLFESLKKVWKPEYMVKEYTIYEKKLIGTLSHKENGEYTAPRGKSDTQNISSYKINYESCSYFIREAKLDDIDAICKMTNEEPSKVVNRFFGKQRCFIISCQDKIVHCTWVDTRMIELSDIKYEQNFEGGRACIREYITDENHKNMGLEMYVLAYIDDILRKDGFTQCCVLVNDKNSVFENYLVKAGFSPESRIKFKRLSRFPVTTEFYLNEKL